MQEYMQAWFDTSEVLELIDPNTAVYLLVVVVVLYIGKLVNDVLSPYSLSQELTEHDNKALALSFSGYFLGLALILAGVLRSDPSIQITGHATRDLLADIGNMTLWGGIGMALLLVARVLNDKTLLHRFDNMKELVEDRNVGTGAVQAGAYVGSALIIVAAMYGDDDSTFPTGLVSTLVYFLLGQLAFVAFGMLYQGVSRFDLHHEIEQNNVAAGVAFGMTLTAIGILLSGYIMNFDSLIGLAVWFAISAFSLVTIRYLVDKLILPGKLLDEEISGDRNWGAALLEGCACIGIAFILNASL